MAYRSWAQSALIVLALGTVLPCTASAEWYVAGQGGVNFADRMNNIQGTGTLQSLQAPDFDLKNAVVYGGKLGYFSGNGAVGIEVDAFHSNPHIKSLGPNPGIHMRVTNVGLNIMLRYPGQTFQPYVGLGGAALIARIAESPANQSSSDGDVGFGVNLIAGMRTFITPYVALFTEYKFTQGTLIFDRAFPPGGGFSGDYRAQHMVFGISYHF